MTKIYAFVGPTFPNFQHPSIHVLPPAKRGDILEINKKSPECILLVDGFFGQQASVMHREILESIRTGIQVIGCSSMGALRAAELYDQGMIGVGKIFKAFRCGQVSGDDEVAMLHGPPELRYCEITFPLCNLRSTVDVVSQRYAEMSGAFANALEIASSLPFFDRSFDNVERLLQDANGEENSSKIINVIRSCWVDQKRLDLTEALSILLGRPRIADMARLHVDRADTSWIRRHKKKISVEPSGVSTRLVEAVVRFYDPTFKDYVLDSFTEAVISRIPSARSGQSVKHEHREIRLAQYLRNWPDADAIGAAGAALFMHPSYDVDVWMQLPPRQLPMSTLLEWARREAAVVDDALHKYRLTPNFGVAVNFAQYIERLLRDQIAGSDFQYKASDSELWLGLKGVRPWLTEPTKAANEFIFDDNDEMFELYGQLAAFESLTLSRGINPWLKVDEQDFGCLTNLIFVVKQLIS